MPTVQSADAEIFYEVTGSGSPVMLIAGLGGAVDGDAFTENIVVADARAGRGVLVFQILRGVADDRADVERSSRLPHRGAGDAGVRGCGGIPRLPGGSGDGAR